MTDLKTRMNIKHNGSRYVIASNLSLVLSKLNCNLNHICFFGARPYSPEGKLKVTMSLIDRLKLFTRAMPLPSVTAALGES